MNIAIDFDGTCVAHDFPLVGKDIGAIPVLKKLIQHGHNLILFTMRSDVEKPVSDNPAIIAIGGKYLSEAIEWFYLNGIPLWGIQTNPEQSSWTTSPKAFAHIYIDDSALGCPLKYDPKVSNKAFVDWGKVEQLLLDRNFFK